MCKIKPLEWTDDNENGISRAEAMLGEYVIVWDPDDSSHSLNIPCDYFFDVVDQHWSRGNDPREHKAKSIQEAKSICVNHFKSLVKSCLV